ncbi:A disintegrin and metalloproteinase with thrombospondin motifs 16 isoform X2 [Folsomia candida]|uniref:A disintegrin and metalloproteinase with thrombospondin motifs 16 isoform X2 n=1 Tax=Folsomia candida TaxID=158441 RepID=UPI0016051E6C|nr:A disintegrin and metalloproteinase with thrombospondin motifs 16 isoform X2 [Folsomia candida]
MQPSLILLLLSFLLFHTEGDSQSTNGGELFGKEFFDTTGNWEEGEVHIFGYETGKRAHRARRTSDNNLNRIKIITGDKQIDIKLEPDPSLLNSVVFKDGDHVTSYSLQESTNCHWKGYVDGGGTAAFSTCQEPNSLTGIVVTEEGLWLIKPRNDEGSLYRSFNKSRSRPRRKTNKNEQIFSHLIMSPEWTTTHLSNWMTGSDVARVPLNELEGAARLAAKDAQQRESQRQPVYDDDPSISLVYSTEQDSFGHYASYFPSWFGWDYFNYDDAEEENQDYGGFRRPPSLFKSASAATLLMERKIRELESKKKWVEMALFTDESMYQRMEKKFPNDTLVKLKDYTTTMVNMMDLLYGGKSLGVDIGFRLVHLEVMKKTPKELDTNGGKAKAYLSSFCEYAGNQNLNSGLWDHALLLTGIDLHEQGLKSTAGLAWAGTMCYRYYSCSGMEHDGLGISETCDRDKFIMSPTTGPGKVTWSNCSSKNLQDFIEYGTSELRSKKYPSQMLSKPTCLSEVVTKGKTSTTKQKLPGENYDAYFQCSLGLGPDFKPYFQRNKTPFNNICWILYCGNGTHAVSTHPAMEGTKCDKNKYCRGGECVKRPQQR